MDEVKTYPVYEFTVIGKPVVQKNDNVIRKKRTKTGKLVPFLSHSDEMKLARNNMAVELYKQFKKQGGVTPIDYLVEANLVFYIDSREPDLDNLLAIVFDAMQGVKQGKVHVGNIITNDKLVRKITCVKILQGDPNYDGQPRTECTLRHYAYWCK